MSNNATHRSEDEYKLLDFIIPFVLFLVIMAMGIVASALKCCCKLKNQHIAYAVSKIVFSDLKAVTEHGETVYLLFDAPLTASALSFHDNFFCPWRCIFYHLGSISFGGDKEM